MSYELAGAPAPRHYTIVRRQTHYNRARQLEGLGFSLKPPKRYRKFIRKAEKVALITAGVAAAAFLAPVVAPAIASAGGAIVSAGKTLAPFALSLLKKKKAGTAPGSVDMGMPTDMGVPTSQGIVADSSGGGGGGSDAAMALPLPPNAPTQDDTTPVPAGTAGNSNGALVIGGLLLAGFLLSRRKG